MTEEHCIGPNGPHLRACGQPRSSRDLAADGFIALLVYPDRHNLCRKCRLALIGTLLCDHARILAGQSGVADMTLSLDANERDFLMRWFGVKL